MRRKLALAGLLFGFVGCGGDGGTGGSNDADVQGTWVVTFTASPTSSCALSQMSLDITQSFSGAPTGNHGAYAIDCGGPQQEQVNPDVITDWSVSGNRLAVKVTPNEILIGDISGNGAAWSGTYDWGVSSKGTFTASKQ